MVRFEDMMTIRRSILVLVAVSARVAAQAAPPAYDHVVVVVEENRSFSQIIGSADAPFINTLAASGAMLTGMHGLTHPSQPNYLHLFSGSNQGQTSNAVPAGQPFSTANLGAALAAAGRTFTGYSESLPSVGYQEGSFTANPPLNEYVRKHNPWMNWVAAAPTGNQLPTTVAQPFTAFPADPATLPSVAFVIPNEQHNMHDGSIAAADAWLQANLAGYATWAASHNSLLVVTWDEDNSSERNRIPTVLFGAGVRPGEVEGTWTLHNLLRTIEDATGAGHSGSAAAVQPIVGAFTSDPATNVATFQQGDAGGYVSATDTWIEATAPTTPHGADTVAVVDGAPLTQALVKFDDLFGVGGRIPVGATILSAKLSLVTESNTSIDPVALHRMLVGWSGSSTWSGFGAGVSTDGVQAAAVSEFQLSPDVASADAIFDVTESLRLWQADPARNQGWLLRNTGGSDGWGWATSETATQDMRPQLSVVYAVPEPTVCTLAASACIALIARRSHLAKRSA
jgi:phosphatidylinositol-3-phosphatase